jgi:hypothetical protein
MNQTKWYEKVLLALVVILLLPFLIVAIPIALLFGDFQRKRDYKKSRYYQDFKVKYTWRKSMSPEYRFYNNAVRRSLPMEYIRQPSNGFEYVIHDGMLFLFPDFFVLKKSEDAAEWIADYDREDKSLEQVMGELTAKPEAPVELPVYLLLERDMIHAADLNSQPLPPWVYLVPAFEDAFESVDFTLLNHAPQTTTELYDMMRKTPDLCGEFELTRDGELIFWHLYDGVRVELSVSPRDGYVGVTSLLDGKEEGITHWHPTEYAVYYEVCKMGKRGNVLVLRTQGGSDWLVYLGDKDGCPYQHDSKKKFTKTYYLEAR